MRMDYQDKYDELDNIISSLNILIDEITDKNYIEQLQEIKFEAMNELEKIEPILQKIYDEEQKEMNREYDLMRL